MTDPTVSVVMPVYNAGAYLAQAVESLLGQSFGDFELIAVDDGSTDGSLAILRGYAAQDRRIRVISRPNTGIVGALNDGLAAARGKYMARMDADDVSEPERLRKQVEYLETHAECAAVGTGAVFFDNAGEEVGRTEPLVEGDKIEEEFLRGRADAIVHASAMMRRTALEGTRGYRAEYELLEDLDIFLQLSDRGRLANLAEPLYRVRYVPGSLSRMKARDLRRQQSVRGRIVREAFGRKGRVPPAGWKLYRKPVEKVYQNAARESLRAGQRLRALAWAVRFLCCRPFSRPALRLMYQVCRRQGVS